jgi:hypothetical protein
MERIVANEAAMKLGTERPFGPGHSPQPRRCAFGKTTEQLTRAQTVCMQHFLIIQIILS